MLVLNYISKIIKAKFLIKDFFSKNYVEYNDNTYCWKIMLFMLKIQRKKLPITCISVPIIFTSCNTIKSTGKHNS